jgi:hypothetical protein
MRAVDAASLWVDHCASWQPDRDRPLRIADFGAGNERLRDVLAARLVQPFAYFPYDRHPQRRSTVRLDVLEETPSDTFDLVFCLGLLEYLPPGNTFLERLTTCCRFAIVSFVYVGSSFKGDRREREALHWRAHYDRRSFEEQFASLGFFNVAFRTTGGGQTGLWLWKSPMRTVLATR